MKKKAIAGVLGLAVALSLTGCGNTTSVDAKLTLTVPAVDGKPATICYFLEVETVNSSGEEISETNECVSKEVWDRQVEGEQRK
jgi:hypothetical protein